LYWMAKQVQYVIESHPDYGQRPLKLLDVGGGRGLLANHLATHLDGIEIEVIDIAQGAIQNGAMRSRRRQLAVKYTAGDASQVNFRGTVDIVVALHACGVLSDVAMAQAVSNNAAFVICPCCFRSNRNLRVPVLSSIHNEPIPVEEWLGVEEEKFSALQMLAEVQGNIPLSSKAMHSICALRAAAFERHTNAPVRVSIRTFPLAYSTRNYCLVGKFDAKSRVDGFFSSLSL
jgi:hypothetical protein